MSADNGIYVFVSPTSTGREYRVAHAQAIDNIDYFEEGTPECEAMEVVYFGSAKICKSHNEAMEEAINELKKVPFTEYGISFLPESKRSFPTMSLEEANFLLR
jgi:hypothetical protein